MKEKYLLMLLLLTFVACTNKLPEQGVSTSVGEPTSTVITADMAVDNLNEFLLEYQAQTRSTTPRKIAGVVSKGGFGETRAEGSEVDEPLYHIVSFEDNQGYAVMSGDNRIAPVLSFVEQGSYDPEEEITDVRLLALYSDIDIMYRMAVGLPIQNEDGEWIEPVGQDGNGDFIYPMGGMPDTGFVDDRVPGDDGSGGGTTPTVSISYTDWTTYSIKGQELLCCWDQYGEPYNTLTKTVDGHTAYAGCVATAVAQIMYYWGHDYTYDGYAFDWDLMRQHISKSDPEREAYDMISNLFLKLGLPENLNMTYGENGSHASNSNVPRTFRHFGFSNGGCQVDYNISTICDVIQNRPVYICAYRINENGDRKGHAWVLDKVWTKGRTKTTTWLPSGNSTSVVEYQYLVHCNFGYSGYYNGYYYSGDFDLANPVISDDTTDPKTIDRNYQYDQTMNVGISLL